MGMQGTEGYNTRIQYDDRVPCRELFTLFWFVAPRPGSLRYLVIEVLTKRAYVTASPTLSTPQTIEAGWDSIFSKLDVLRGAFLGALRITLVRSLVSGNGGQIPTTPGLRSNLQSARNHRGPFPEGLDFPANAASCVSRQGHLSTAIEIPILPSGLC